MKQMIALSYSRLSDFEQCKLKFKSKYIDKSYPDESDNPAFVKGNTIHKQLEDYVNSMTDNKDPPIMGVHSSAVIPIIHSLHKSCNGNIHSEKQVAVNQEWKECAWFDKPDIVKYRAIIDCMGFQDNVLILLDYKSGKVYEYQDSPLSQLRLSAVIFFNLYPHIDKIISSYLYVEHKKTEKVTFHRKDLEEMQAPFDDAYDRVQREEEFAYTKNKYCNWCLVKDCPIRNK